MYAGGGELTEKIDYVGETGTESLQAEPLIHFI